MLRERINKTFNNKTLYLVVSIIAAFTLWVYVTNVDNQNTETTIFGIGVNFTGKEALEAKGLVIDDSYNYSVSLSVLGKRDAVLKLKNTNISVNLDVSDIGSAGSYDKFYSVVLPLSVSANEVYILKKTQEYVTVRVIQQITKTVGVRGSFSGTLKEGFEAQTLTFSPNTITVSGPENIVSRISYASIKITQKDVDNTLNQNLKYVFMDKDDNEVAMDKLIVNTKTVDVTLPVLLTKKVPLTIKLSPVAGAPESNVKYSVDPKTITLTGDPEVLGKINEILLKTYNIADILTDQSEICDILIPKGLTNIDGITKAKINISVTGLVTKDITVSNIKIINVYAGHKATLVKKDLSITVRGEQSVLDSITADNITTIIDLTELGQAVGKYTVPAKIEISGTSKAEVIGTYPVSVVLEAT